MRKRPTSKSMALCLAVLAAATVLGAAADAMAQTPYMPYYGKNLVRYDRFDWQIYKTEHFEIYYYPSIEQHLERVAGYAESAYQQISAELKHDLAFKVPLIIFKTHSEFEQQNVIPGAAQEGVGAFAEPYRDRMLLPLDDPPDLLYRLIVHELTHIFEFDIVPQSLIRETVPLWVAEGLSDYMTGIWRPVDLMTVRDAAITDIVPKMSRARGLRADVEPAACLQPRPRRVRVHRVEVGQGRPSPVPLLAAQGHRGRRRERLPRGVPVVGRGVRPAVRSVPQGPLQTVPRQGNAVRLRPQPRAVAGEDALRRRHHDRAVAVRRPAGGGHHQPERPGDRHRPDLGEGRQGHPQPHARLRPGHGLRLHRDARQPLDHRPVAGVVAGRRSPGVRRQAREGQGHRHPERA